MKKTPNSFRFDDFAFQIDWLHYEHRANIFNLALSWRAPPAASLFRSHKTYQS